MHLSYSLIATFSRSICVMHSYMNANFLWNLVREIQVKTQTNRDRQVEPSTTNEQCTQTICTIPIVEKKRKFQIIIAIIWKNWKKLTIEKKMNFFEKEKKKCAYCTCHVEFSAENRAYSTNWWFHFNFMYNFDSYLRRYLISLYASKYMYGMFPIWHRNVDDEKKQHSDNDMLMMIYLFWLDYFRNVSKFNFHHKIYKILPNWLAPQKVCPNSKRSSESYAPRLTSRFE